MRKLASIQKVLSVDVHPNADRLAIIRVLGWNLVSGKDEFKAGDLCCYVECDSILPDQPEFEFLRSKSFRIKTMRLRGAISQGIAFKIDKVLPSGNYQEGDDVTDILGVTKYEPPVSLTSSGEVLGEFPSWIPQTDETRLQADPTILERYKGVMFQMREKLDGCSATYAMKDDEFYVMGRTQRLAESTSNLYWHVAKQHNVEDKLRALGGNIAVQGEVIGTNVEGNWYGLTGKDFYVFNAFNIDKYQYLDALTLPVVVEQQLGLKLCPLLGNIELNHSVDQMVQIASINSTLNTARLAEGIVFRPLTEQRDLILGRLSFKVINPNYLLERGE